MTHICFSTLTIIGSDNGLSPGWRQAIIYTNDGILLLGPLGTNFSEILIKIHTFSLKNAFENVFWKMASIFLILNVLTVTEVRTWTCSYIPQFYIDGMIYSGFYI